MLLHNYKLLLINLQMPIVEISRNEERTTRITSVITGIFDSETELNGPGTLFFAPC